MPVSPRYLRDLYTLLSVVDSPKEAELLLRDILTPKEIASVAERWQLVQALLSGMPQREISKKLGISISKITRGSRMLQEGGEGFRLLMKKMRKK